MRAATPPLIALEAGLVIAWSSGFIGARLAADVSSVFLVLFWRFVIVGLLLLPVLWFAIRAGLTRRSIALQATLGAFAMFGYLALGVKAIELNVPAGTAALISAFQPLATAVLVAPVLGEQVDRRQWLGLAIGLTGVALAVGGSIGHAPLWAYALSLASMGSLVVGTLIAKAVPDPTPLMPALAVQSIVTAMLFAPLALLDGGIRPVADAGFVAAIAWFILFSTIGGYGLYWLCLRRTTAIRVGSLIYLTPPVTMIWAWAMFAEPMTPLAVTGFAVCLLGVALTRPSATQGPKRSSSLPDARRTSCPE